MNKQLFKLIAALTLCGLLGSSHAAELAQANSDSCLIADAGPNHDGSHDFDFMSGDWSIHGRKRIGRFVGSTKWEETVGIKHSRHVGEMGALEEVTFPQWRPDFKLLVVRQYNPMTRRWSLFDFVDFKLISTPLSGTFNSGLGILIGDDVIDGQAVKVRYTYTCDRTHPRFRQEFSNDGGKTWEIDWDMEYTKIK